MGAKTEAAAVKPAAKATTSPAAIAPLLLGTTQECEEAKRSAGDKTQTSALWRERAVNPTALG